MCEKSLEREAGPSSPEDVQAVARREDSILEAAGTHCTL